MFVGIWVPLVQIVAPVNKWVLVIVIGTASFLFALLVGYVWDKMKLWKEETRESVKRSITYTEPLEKERKYLIPLQLETAKAVAEMTKNTELEKKLADANRVELKDIPPVPDYMDPDYEKKIEQRDAIIVQHAQEDAAKKAFAKSENDKAVAIQNQMAADFKTVVDNFDTRTKDLKLDKQTLIDSENVVGSFLVGKNDLSRFLMSDPNGPLNVLYLSQNAAELEKISKMPETDAAVYVAQKIAPEALKLKPKTTNAPDPAYQPSGKGIVDAEDPNLEGCTFT